MEGPDVLLKATNAIEYTDPKAELSAKELQIINQNVSMNNRYTQKPETFQRIKAQLKSAYRNDGDSRFKALLYKDLSDSSFNQFTKSLDSVYDTYKPDQSDVSVVTEGTYHLGTYFHIQCVLAVLGIMLVIYAVLSLLKDKSYISNDILSIGVLFGVILAYVSGRNAYNEYIVYADEPHWLLSKIF